MTQRDDERDERRLDAAAERDERKHDAAEQRDERLREAEDRRSERASDHADLQESVRLHLRELVLLAIFLLILIVPPSFILYQKEQETAQHTERARAFAVSVCESVNAAHRSLTTEHATVRGFFQQAIRARQADAKNAVTPKQREANLRAVAAYKQLIAAFQPIKVPKCSVPE